MRPGLSSHTCLMAEGHTLDSCSSGVRHMYASAAAACIGRLGQAGGRVRQHDDSAFHFLLFSIGIILTFFGANLYQLHEGRKHASAAAGEARDSITMSRSDDIGHRLLLIVAVALQVTSTLERWYYTR